MHWGGNGKVLRRTGLYSHTALKPPPVTMRFELNSTIAHPKYFPKTMSSGFMFYVAMWGSSRAIPVLIFSQNVFAKRKRVHYWLLAVTWNAKRPRKQRCKKCSWTNVSHSLAPHIPPCLNNTIGVNRAHIQHSMTTMWLPNKMQLLAIKNNFTLVWLLLYRLQNAVGVY